jgi:hypothetical protein
MRRFDLSDDWRRLFDKCNTYRIILLSGRRKNEFPGKKEKNGETHDEKKNQAPFSSGLGSDALHTALGWLRRGVSFDSQKESWLATVAAIGIAPDETVDPLGHACAMGSAKQGSIAGRAMNRFGCAVAHRQAVKTTTRSLTHDPSTFAGDGTNFHRLKLIMHVNQRILNTQWTQPGIVTYFTIQQTTGTASRMLEGVSVFLAERKATSFRHLAFT